MRNENGGANGPYGWHEEELTPEQKRYLQIVNSERSRQAGKTQGTEMYDRQIRDRGI